MKSRFVPSMAALLAGTGMALGQGSGNSTSTTWAPIKSAPPAATAPARVEASPGHPAYQMAGSPYAGAANSFTVLGDGQAAPAVAAPPSHALPSMMGSAAYGGNAACGPIGCATDACGASGLYPGNQWWGGVEYLLWWKRDGRLPTIMGRAAGTLANVNPLPANGIDPLFGGPANQLDYREQSGVRFTVGGWLDADQQFGVEANYWQLERGSLGFSGSSNGDPILGPVFFDPVTNRETIILLASPNRSRATVSANARDRMWGFEANARIRKAAIFSESSHLIVGVRHLQLDEGVDTFSTGTILPTVPVVGGTRLVTYDSIGVHNRFYAAQAGFACDFRHAGWFANVAGKLAMGVMHEKVNIQGGSTITSPAGEVVRLDGGVLAQRTNIGRQNSYKFAVMPEFTLNTGYQFTENLRAFVGYNFFVITSVARAGDQIDGVDSRGVQILSAFDSNVRPSRPYQHFQTTHLWVQGLNFGMELRY